MPRDSCVSLCVCTVSLLILLTIAGCGGTASIEGPQPAESVGGPAVLHDIPGVPDPLSPLHSSSALISGEFLEADEYASLGASWDVEGRLLSLEREGLSYSILATLSPVYNTLAITVDGELNGAWLGISDYSRKAWRWLAGPLDGSTIVTAPWELGMSPVGEVFVILVCPDGAAAAVTVSRSFAFDIISPPDGLGEWPVVPDDLLDAYDDVLEALATGFALDFLIEATLPQRRAYIYYTFSRESEISLDTIILVSQVCERDDFTPLVELIDQQYMWDMSFDYYLLKRQSYVLQYPEETTRAELAWTADWLVRHYPGAMLTAEADTYGGPPP